MHSLDGLRAIAAVLVVIHHLGAANAAAALTATGRVFAANLISGLTASGVELFFVISAIVLARPYMNGRPIRLWPYARRRLERLYPPFFGAWLLAGATVALATAFPTWWTLSAGLPNFSVTTWLQQLGIVYVGAKPYNDAWWSLTVEVTFYVLLPLLLWLLSRVRTLQGMYGVLGCAVAISATPIPGPPVIIYNLQQYASCFCAGILLSRHLPSLRTALGFALAGAAWVVGAARWDVMNPHVGWGLVYLGFVACALTSNTRLQRRLSTYGFVWLGERSYSLFLVHYSVIWIACHAASTLFSGKTFGYFILSRVLAVPLSILAAMLLFHVVERRWARNLATAEDFIPAPRRAIAYAA